MADTPAPATAPTVSYRPAPLVLAGALLAVAVLACALLVRGAEQGAAAAVFAAGLLALVGAVAAAVASTRTAR